MQLASRYIGYASMLLAFLADYCVQNSPAPLGQPLWRRCINDATVASFPRRNGGDLTQRVGGKTW